MKDQFSLFETEGPCTGQKYKNERSPIFEQPTSNMRDVEELFLHHNILNQTICF